MAALVEMEDEHWSHVTGRMQRWLDAGRVPEDLRERFEGTLREMERTNHVRGIPNVIVLEIVKAIREPWGVKDTELRPLADAFERSARASMARGEE
jgi:hypothetical protein